MGWDSEMEQAFQPDTFIVPCPHCFESSGYVWEHGNDWNSGPWSHQTNIPCPKCDGAGVILTDGTEQNNEAA